MLEDGAKSFRIPILFPWLYAKYSKHFLYHNHWCVELSKSMLFSIWYHKKLIKFRGYSLIHINEMINLKSMGLIYLH